MWLGEVADLLQLRNHGDSRVSLSRVTQEVGEQVVNVGGASDDITEQFEEERLVREECCVCQAVSETLQ